ncbi:MAG: hypothetical protein LBB10_00145 [Bifidobacteriaceae bacterium]|jgi:hypothetical protein|nr:hypothetical protein [Bifidobacteriaceae bacterium]
MNTKIKLQKVGTIITVLLFGLICAIGGYELRSSTDSASSPLPVSKGGTGANSAQGAQTNLGMKTSVSESSTDTEFPSSKAVYNYANPESWITASGVHFDIRYRKYMGFLFVEITSASLKASLGTNDQNENITLPEGYRPSHNNSCGTVLSMQGALYGRTWINVAGVTKMNSGVSSTIASGSWLLGPSFWCALQ